MERPSVQFLIPVFNEEDCLPALFQRLEAVKETNSKEFLLKAIFINDGSTDQTRDVISDYCSKNKFIQLINLSRNFGHQVAITAGIDHADADFCIVMDADMQDPPELANEFFMRGKSGFDVVYARRTKRLGETHVKKLTAAIFYIIFGKLSSIDIHHDAGDFYFFNRKVLTALKKMHEKHRFIRGLLPWAGFSSTFIEYERSQRLAGSTKFPMKKMLSFSIDAIFSFSSLPIRVAIMLGFGIILTGLIFSFYLIYQKLFGVQPTEGLTVTLLAILLVGGLQVMMLGVVGEYIGRIYEEVKNRPLYFIQDKVNF